jgi:hypothetical protein
MHSFHSRAREIGRRRDVANRPDAFAGVQRQLQEFTIVTGSNEPAGVVE